MSDPMPDVIVVVPGILGSVLQKDGKTVWGWPPAEMVRALLTLGGSIREALELAGDDPALDDLGDGVVASDIMRSMHILPGFWKIDVYEPLLAGLRQQFQVTEGRNLFVHPYDWRRHNEVAARALGRKARAYLKAWRESANPDAKLILLAHSMGGLVCRRFLEMDEGWKDTKALITFGTPYRGSLNAVDVLCNGVRKGRLELPELTTVARSLTSIYELLPIYPCVDAGGAGYARVSEVAGLPNLDQAKAAAALRFQTEIRDAQKSNAADGAYQQSGYDLFAVVGTAQPTSESVLFRGGGAEMLPTYTDATTGEVRDYEGDGTVPRMSASPRDEGRTLQPMYAANAHSTLQNSSAVLAYVCGVLSGLYMTDVGFLGKGSGMPSVEVSTEDIHWADEPVRVAAKTIPGLTLAATVVDAAGAVSYEGPMTGGEDGSYAAEMAIPAGTYRVTVSGPGVDPASDAFAVADMPRPV
jgi:pimeloyl-ACP methyl ester carboxylesterase